MAAKVNWVPGEEVNSTKLNQVGADINAAQAAAEGRYLKPGPGIPESDLAAAVSAKLALAVSAVQTAAMTAAITNAVQTGINNLIASAPGTMDTLDEIAAALGDDPNFVATITGLINAKYSKPAPGIPESDLASGVSAKLALAVSALQALPTINPTDIAGLAEYIRDTVAVFAVPGANMTITHNDAGDTLSFASTGGSGGEGGLTEAQVNALISSAVNALIASAPGTLDTLDELAAALGDDANFAATITALVNTKQPKLLTGTTATAIGTAAKVVTLDYPSNAYVPVAGDMLAVTYTNGNNAANATLAVNGGAARSTRLGSGSPGGYHHAVASGGVALYRFDGTVFNLLGSQMSVEPSSNAGANTLALRDGNGNLFADVFIPTGTDVVLGSTSAANTLAPTSTQLQRYTGIANHATTIHGTSSPGWYWVFMHMGTAGVLTIKSSNNDTITTLDPGETVIVATAVNNATAATQFKLTGGSKLVSGKADKPTGTPDGTKFLRDDNVWATPSGGSALPGVSKVLGAISANSEVTVNHGLNTLGVTAVAVWKSYKYAESGGLYTDTVPGEVIDFKWRRVGGDANNIVLEFADPAADGELVVDIARTAFTSDATGPTAGAISSPGQGLTYIDLALTGGTDAESGNAGVYWYRNGTYIGFSQGDTFRHNGLTSNTSQGPYTARRYNTLGIIGDVSTNSPSYSTLAAGDVAPIGTVAQNRTASGATATAAVTHAAGALRLMRAVVSCSHNEFAAASGYTVALSGGGWVRVPESVSPDVTASGTQPSGSVHEFYRLESAMSTAGTVENVTVTFSGGITPGNVNITVEQYQFVDQTTPMSTMLIDKTGSAVSMTIASNAGDYTLFSGGFYNATPAGYNKTLVGSVQGATGVGYNHFTLVGRAATTVTGNVTHTTTTATAHVALLTNLRKAT